MTNSDILPSGAAKALLLLRALLLRLLGCFLLGHSTSSLKSSATSRSPLHLAARPSATYDKADQITSGGTSATCGHVFLQHSSLLEHHARPTLNSFLSNRSHASNAVTASCFYLLNASQIVKRKLRNRWQ